MDWGRVRAIYEAIADRETEEQRAALDALCGRDTELRAAVERMLAARRERGDFLAGPPHAAAPPEAEEPTVTREFVAPTALLGHVLADRYELLAVLGRGGMGTVFKARDREMGKTVALKLIRPDLAARPDALERFKREVLLSRKVTHRNVVRVFDLGGAGDTRFLTMELIEGETLAALRKAGRQYTPREAALLMAEVAEALEAAHAEGVIHRDLKPQNIMIDAAGRPRVMDFGIARAVVREDSPTMSLAQHLTDTGMVLGTPRYMSPEQGQGRPVDTRTDIFSLGIILYELLTGADPYPAESSVASLVQRSKEPPKAPRDVNPAVPAALSAITMRCLAIEPAQRYPAARDLRIALLDATQPGKAGRRAALAAGAAAALIVGAGGGYLAWEKFGSRPAAPVKPVTMLIADFENATGDPDLEGTLEPMFALVMEDASFINAFNRVQARRIAAQVKPGAGRLDEETARLVAVREGIDTVVAGRILAQGGRYSLTVAVRDAVTGRQLAQSGADATQRQEILKAVARVAAPVRRALGDTKPDTQQVREAETFTANSLEAASRYAKAQEFALLGRWDEAIAAYQETLKLDPRMGRAWAGLAVVHRNTGRAQEAVENYQKALEHIDRMTAREKYRTRGGYYVTTQNHRKAVEEFQALVDNYPADTAGHANLALAYLFLRDLPKSLSEGRKAIEIYPKNIPQRNNVALYALYAGDFETAEREARAVLAMDPKFVKAYVALALAALAKDSPHIAEQHYRSMAETGPRGASFAAAGLADLALTKGNAPEAIEILAKGIAADEAAGNRDAAAIKTAAQAQAYWMDGRRAEASAAAERALALDANLAEAHAIKARILSEGGRH
ncbi:MAG TPA: hypothetical protein DEH78_18215, partial [Solibacterales bacterium]|nr:hypothetical protein [Bryobacterales bacterium]